MADTTETETTETEESFEKKVLDALSGPAEVSIDGNTVRQRSPEELEKALRIASSMKVRRKPYNALGFARMVPPGAVEY